MEAKKFTGEREVGSLESTIQVEKRTSKDRLLGIPVEKPRSLENSLPQEKGKTFGGPAFPGGGNRGDILRVFRRRPGKWHKPPEDNGRDGSAKNHTWNLEGMAAYLAAILSKVAFVDNGAPFAKVAFAHFAPFFGAFLLGFSASRLTAAAKSPHTQQVEWLVLSSADLLLLSGFRF